ncbi:DegT/DnrJ/EryC1/StrS family aminotransferase [Roseomonas stagni]|uniref:DegT/DnrJ/EryC1/StrS family aminotransferase n=1 Tax=Falsiroseomonas algicola TaxID=2716930 RepID=A0A6M1LKI9_9PROT|nr:DegT/DnrJ/EryC1/StrS family aminotransferase [Falsiroseomonas algicola]NGM20846.1 DegT/DnrJ/EryC1/StrS family aminotransferase [Falsiroseomonas algicola]
MIPVYDRRKLYLDDKDAIDAAVARVLASGRYDWGEEVPAFEAELAAWLGAKHFVATGSGTAALKSAFRALRIGPGHEVITVANTDMANSTAIHSVGATVVWVDIDPLTRCMDPAACAAAITPRTAAILPVDIYGHPCDIRAFRELADRHGLALIEDACLALGAEIDGQLVGRHADVTCFSFSSGKHLGAMGNAGGCATEDAAIAQRLRLLSGDGQDRARHRMQPRPLDLHHEEESHNDRMDEIQAAVLRAKLPSLHRTLAQRRAQAARYAQALADVVQAPSERSGVRHAWRNYVIETEDREALAGHLTAQGIQCNALYNPPMHLQPAYAGLGFKRGLLPKTEAFADRLLGLPIGPHLRMAEIEAVIAAIRQWNGASAGRTSL